MKSEVKKATEEVKAPYLYGIYMIDTIENHLLEDPAEIYQDDIDADQVHPLEGFYDLDEALEALKKYKSYICDKTRDRHFPRFETEIYIVADVEEGHDRFEDTCYGAETYAIAEFDSECLSRFVKEDERLDDEDEEESVDEEEDDDDDIDEDIY